MSTPSVEARAKKSHAVCAVSELPVGERKLVMMPAFGREIEIGVFNVGGKYFAYRNVCPHAGAPVCLGKICGTTTSSEVYQIEHAREGEILRCPWHGWEFDLLTGEHLVDERTRLKSYEVAIAAGEPRDDSEDLEAFEIEVRDETIYVLI